MWLFADEVQSPTIYNIILAVVGSGGVLWLLVKALDKWIDNNKDIEIRRLEMQAKDKEEDARQKAVVAEERKEENREIKEANNELHNRYKQLATRFEKEALKVDMKYEAKCA